MIRRNAIVRTLLLATGAILVTILIHSFVAQPYQVNGTSMQPTLLDGDRLLVEKLGKSFSRLLGNHFVPKRGQIIVFSHEKNGQNTELIKRVIGLPGESIAIRKGTIIIYNDDNPLGVALMLGDGIELAKANIALDRTAIGSQEVFVLGDNRLDGASLDSSNALGNINLKNINGVLSMRILPLSRTSFF